MVVDLKFLLQGTPIIGMGHSVSVIHHFRPTLGQERV